MLAECAVCRQQLPDARVYKGWPSSRSPMTKRKTQRITAYKGKPPNQPLLGEQGGPPEKRSLPS